MDRHCVAIPPPGRASARARLAWLGGTIQDRGPSVHDPEEDARACMDLLKAKIRNAFPFPANKGRRVQPVQDDYEPIPAAVQMGTAHTVIVDHG